MLNWRRCGARGSSTAGTLAAGLSSNPGHRKSWLLSPPAWLTRAPAKGNWCLGYGFWKFARGLFCVVFVPPQSFPPNDSAHIFRMFPLVSTTWVRNTRSLSRIIEYMFDFRGQSGRNMLSIYSIFVPVLVYYRGSEGCGVGNCIIRGRNRAFPQQRNGQPKKGRT